MARLQSETLAPRTSGAVATPQLPAGFASLANQQINATASSAVKDAFIWFASKKSKQWDEYSQRLGGSLVEGDTVYVSPDHIEVIRVMKYHPIAVEQYWSRKDKLTGQPSSKPQKSDPGRAAGFEEYIDTVLLVQTSKGLLPARCRFKSGLIGAISKAIEELKTVRDDLESWSSRSAAHAIAAKIPTPAFRFVAEASFGMKTAKGSGMQYLNGRVTCRPTSPDDAKLLAGLSDPGVAALCELVAEEHKNRLAALDKLPA